MSEAIELTGENVASYFNDVVLPHLPNDSEVVATTEITEFTGVNWIFSVDVKNGDTGEIETDYLKQSRNTVKQYPDMKRPSQRIATEYRAIEFLRTLISNNVPEVINFDAENNVLALTDIKRSGQHYAQELAAGRVHPEIGTTMGEIVARVQAATLGDTFDNMLGADVNFSKNKTSMADILGFRAESALSLYPELTNRVLRRSYQGSKALILGDLSPKNMFVEGPEARFLDFERVAVGDLALDPAYLFIGPLIEVDPAFLPQSLEFVTNFMKSYIESLSEQFSVSSLDMFQNHISRFMGIMILHRTQGKYFVKDVGEENRKLWQERAATMLADNQSMSVVAALERAGIS